MEHYYVIKVFVNDVEVYKQVIKSDNKTKLSQYCDYTEQCIREFQIVNNPRAVIKSTCENIANEAMEVNDVMIQEKESLLKEYSKNKQERIELLRKINLLHN